MRRGSLALLLVGTVALGCNTSPPASPDPGPPIVTVAKPVVRPVTQFTDLTGTLAAVKTADVRPQVGGRIERVLFKDGSEVKAGDVLVKIDPTLYKADLSKAKADKANADAQLVKAKADEARFTPLRASGAVSQQELDQFIAARQVAEASVGSFLAAVERAAENLRYTDVTAPFDGRVDRIYVNEGNVVSASGTGGAGTVLTRIVTVDPVYAYFDVDERTVLDYMRRIAAKQFQSVNEKESPVEIQLRNETGYPHKGALEFVSVQLNPATGSRQVRGRFPNPPTGPGAVRLLVPGLFVRGRIPLATAEHALLIPDAAVTTDQAKRVVYVVGPDNRVVAKPVVLGPLSDGLRVIAEGLTPDDTVIIRGLQRVQPGAQVEPQPGKIGESNPASGGR